MEGNQRQHLRQVASIIQTHPSIGIEEIVFDLSKPTGDIGRFADSTLASRELGWTPKVELRIGLHQLIDQITNDWK